MKAEADNPTILYKFRPIKPLDWIADILVSQRLYCPRYFELNDPYEGIGLVYWCNQHNPNQRYFAQTSPDDLLAPEDENTFRVCSLSGSYHDIRLWSHYAGGHRGVAIGIDFKGVKVPPVRVNYLEGLKEYDSTLNGAPDSRGLLSNKTKHWQHENEYRIFTKNQFYDVAGRINSVLLGPRCRPPEVNLIKRLVPDRVPVIRTRLNELTVQVERIEQKP
jgi:hypothetical protein